MAEKISYSVSSQTLAGPQLKNTGSIELDSYVKTQVTIEGGAAEVEVQVQPDGEDQARFVHMTSSVNDGKVSYRVNDVGAGSIALDGPLVLIGSGAVSLLGTNVTKVFLSNASANPAQIDILIGREAQPLP